MKKKLAFLVIVSIIGILVSGINPLQLYATTYPTAKIGISFSLICSLAQWNYRKQIIINSSLVETSLIDFPVLIYKESDDDLAARAAADGSDIIFVSSSVEWSTGLPEDRLAHEIEQYDGDTGELVAWVKIPFLSSTTDTVIYMYYNNKSPVCEDTNWQDPHGVWTNNFHGVWHFNQESGDVLDSTSFENHGTASGGPSYNVEGKIGGAMAFDGVNDYVSCGNPDSLNFGTGDFTLECWVKTEQSDTRHIIAKTRYPSLSDNGYTLSINSDRLEGNLIENANPHSLGLSNGEINHGSWHHVAIVFDRDGLGSYYIDGIIDKEAVDISDWGGSTSGSSHFWFARRQYQAGPLYDYYGGLIDEARVSNVARNASWINTTYRTMAMPDSFLSFGEENTDILFSSLSDGYIFATKSGLVGYKDAYEAETGTVEDTNVYIAIGQKNDRGDYTIYRGFVFFNTSSIPDHAIITSATLSLYGYQDYSTLRDFDIVIQNGQPQYPHDPLQSSDYYYENYAGNGGSVNTASFTTAGYNKISLNSQGIGWLNTTSLTKLCLRSSWDIAFNGPSPAGGNEYVTVYAAEQGKGYKPKLTVTYTFPWLLPQTVTITGTTDIEDTTLVSGGNVAYNYGGSTWICGSPSNVALVRVKNVSSYIPAGSTIVSCNLSIYFYSVTGIGGGGLIWDAHRVFKPWVEGNLDGEEPEEGEGSTWNDWSADSKAWGVAGCNNASDDGVDNSGDGTGRDRKATAESSVLVNAAGWYNWTISPGLVQGWLDGTINEEGIALVCPAGGLVTTHAYSSEGTTPLYWTITYIPP